MIDSGTFDMVHQLSKDVIHFSEIAFVTAVICSLFLVAERRRWKAFLFGVLFPPVSTLILGGVLSFSNLSCLWF